MSKRAPQRVAASEMSLVAGPLPNTIAEPWGAMGRRGRERSRGNEKDVSLAASPYRFFYSIATRQELASVVCEKCL